uniref:Uncharacterized protein n=1 Tax=Lutzomyia longipalpis TaxID=7200 RepID=A0A1B0CQ53_LUTLO
MMVLKIPEGNLINIKTTHITVNEGRDRLGPCCCGGKNLPHLSKLDLKDYMRQAGEVTYADAHKQRRNEGSSRYGPPLRTEYRLIVENLSSRVSWQEVEKWTLYRLAFWELSHGSPLQAERAGDDVCGMVTWIEEKFVIDASCATEAGARAHGHLIINLRRIAVVGLPRWPLLAQIHITLIREGVPSCDLSFCLLSTNILRVHCHEAQNEEIYAGCHNGESEEDEDET